MRCTVDTARDPTTRISNGILVCLQWKRARLKSTRSELSDAVSTTCFRDRGVECDPPTYGRERAGIPGRRRGALLSHLAITFERDLYGFTPGFWCELKSTYMNVYVSTSKHP